ncbi:hypothetical protein BY458DRAFT_507683 [Sporodiniella umbellata]|nr:hypothetical protein BY458DRAFT_507683 [Sporodiniella umbellata]
MVSEQEDIQTANSIIGFLCEYDMFHSFVIWNNNLEIQLSNEFLKRCSHKTIKIVNSPVNVGVVGRYLACQTSLSLYCYFQDVFTEKPRLRSVYSNFLKSTHLIHGESSSYDSYIDTQWRYCFSNEDINLHACYIRMETGNFIIKEAAAKFIEKYNGTNVMDKVSADIYFSLFMNRAPHQIEGHGTLTKSLGESEIGHMNNGLDTLYSNLSNNKFTPIQSHTDNSLEYHTRAACKFDQCLFLTNLEAFPNLELFSYNPAITVITSKKMHEDYLDKDQTSFYQNAVDGDDHSSWKSVHNIRKGDYIGLDLLMSMRIRLKYRLVIRDFYKYKAGLKIQTSSDNLNWVPLHTLPSTKCTNPGSDQTLFECYFIINKTAYRYIRLESQMDHDFRFDVYDFSFSGKVKQDASGQLLDISFDEDNITYLEDEQ